jgi:hypothetical protein
MVERVVLVVRALEFESPFLCVWVPLVPNNFEVL